jgi:rRNA processing protein Gar1
LQEAGTVLHLARSGRLIVKSSGSLRDGTPLVDSEGRSAGRVMETIGPVKSPYLSVQPSTDRIERLIGTKLFVSEVSVDGERRRGFSDRKRPRGKKWENSDKNKRNFPPSRGNKR